MDFELAGRLVLAYLGRPIVAPHSGAVSPALVKEDALTRLACMRFVQAMARGEFLPVVDASDARAEGYLEALVDVEGEIGSLRMGTRDDYRNALTDALSKVDDLAAAARGEDEGDDDA